MKCPCCGQRRGLHFSRSRSWFERIILRKIGLRPVRCRACNGRFLSFSNPGEEVFQASEGFRKEPGEGETLRQLTEQLKRAEEALSEFKEAPR